MRGLGSALPLLCSVTFSREQHLSKLQPLSLQNVKVGITNLTWSKDWSPEKREQEGRQEGRLSSP
jgi:hypothetical protein